MPRHSNTLPHFIRQFTKSIWRCLQMWSTLEGCCDTYKVEPLLPHTVNDHHRMLIYFVSQLSNCCHRVLVSHTSIPSMLQCFQETAAPGNWFLMTMSPALAMVHESECPRLQWNSTAPEWMERNIMRLLSLRIAGMDSLGFVQHHLLSTHDREECHMRKSCFLLHFLMLKATKICLLYPERSLSSPPLQETPPMPSPPKPPAATQREGDEKQSPTMMPPSDIASWKEQALCIIKKLVLHDATCGCYCLKCIN